MSKRGAGTTLTQNNWDADDDKEEPGTFSRVSESELKNRIIRKAKRSLNSSSGGTGTSPFAAFSGFGGASSPFSLMKKTDNANSGQSPLVKNRENSIEKENGKTAESKSDKDAQETQKTASNTGSKPAARSIEYYRQLQSLNESILRWMQLHLAKNACCDFTPVFNDYKKHMDTLNFTYPIKKVDPPEVKSSDSKTEKSQSEVKSSGFFKSSAASGDTSEEKEKNSVNSNALANSGFKMNSTKKDDETDYGANFSSRTTNTSTFSFGMKCTPTASSSVSPMGPTSSSKEEEKVPEKKPFQFTFGVTQKTNDSGASGGFFASAIAAKSAETEDTEEKEYEPPKNEFTPITEENALYSKRCKLFFKKGEGFADKGVGTLFLKSLDNKTQLLIRADTSLGNILLNIMLSASLPMSRTGKNNVLLVCVPNPPIDAKNADSKEAIPMLIRVKTAEDADELLENLNKYKS